MNILHALWMPPTSPAESGGLLFWAETSEQPQPPWQRGRAAKHPKPKEHPFCAPPDLLQTWLKRPGETRAAALRLPTTRSGPLPSPSLIHTWDLDLETPPALAPWTVQGVWLPAGQAWRALLNLPTQKDQLVAASDQPADRLPPAHPFLPGDDAIFWRHCTGLVMEALAGQKVVPALVMAGSAAYARWQPVLDGPKDGPRLAQLEAALPPICRAAYSADPAAEPAPPRVLLSTFLNMTCDALARQFGQPLAPSFPRYDDNPANRWIAALFSADPAVQAAPGQIQSLLASHRAWMRSLSAAGDESFRVAFRLDSPEAAQPSGEALWQLQYLLQARDDPSLFLPAEEVWKKAGSVLNQLGKRLENPQEMLLTGLGYAARLFPPLLDSLKSKRPSNVALSTPATYTFLREAAPLLEGAGFGLLVPPWWNKPGARLGLRLKMKPKQKMAEITQGRMTLENLVSYQWELALGETSLTEEEFHALAQLKSPLVQFRGQWVQLDPEQIEAAIHFWEKRQVSGDMGLLEALQYELGGQAVEGALPLDEVTAEGGLADWLERFRHPDRLEELAQPAGLRGTLRPYQRYGYSWLHFHRRWQLGACLADDMGLGKTLQTIALLLNEKESAGKLDGPTLLICPTSVVTNWEREVQRFAPGLTTWMHQGAQRLRGDAFVEAAQSVDIVLTSYALARMDAEILQSIDWLGVILDEAQNIKNPSARQTQAIRKLPAQFRLALTGTPVENRLSELWSIMHFLNPGFLGSRQQFRAQFALPIERYQDQDALARLKQLTGPFILRRVKSDPRVIQDLPEKVETKVYCRLTEEQATLYEAVVQTAMQQIEEETGIERRGQVLSMLMQLKQICNHPTQYLHEASSDRDAAAEFDMAGRSGKLERLVELLEEILAAQDRVLIFTQFAEMGQLLAGYLPSVTGTAAQFLHGGTPVKMRDQMVRRFQEEDSAPPIFILSLKAGGTGLNLTRANHVLHFDRWWNPAVEDQATDRAFRIGQKRNVQVHKFVTTGTLEEMIDDMIESKKGLAQSVISSGEQWLTELSTADLRKLVELRVDR